MIRRSALATLLLAGRALGEPPTDPEAAADVRAALVFIYGDDDVLNPPDASESPSPAAGIGDRDGYDPLLTGYRSRYTGRENRLELRLHGSASGFSPSVATAGELALGADLSSLGEHDDAVHGEPLRLEDVGSFVEARFFFGARDERARPDRGAGEPAVAIRLYPINGDFERVGWLEALGWGGATGPRRESPYASSRGPVRAARLSLALSPVEIFMGLKTAAFTEPVPNAPAVEETSYGVFGGVEARPVELLKLAVAGGYFEHGVLDGPASGARATTSGGSARVSIQRGMDEPRSPVAFMGHEDDPFRSSDPAPPGSFSFGAEVTGLVQRLGDFDRPGDTVLAPARALALFGGARLGPFETSAALVLRDPEFVMRNAPGVFPSQTVPSAAQRESERSVLLSNGLVLSKLVRVDLELGLRFPAAVMVGALDRLGQPTGATLVLNAPGDVELLPVGAVPVPIFDARVALEARLSRLLSAVAWIQYRRNYNRARLDAAGSELVARGFADPDRFGYGLGARAVW